MPDIHVQRTPLADRAIFAVQFVAVLTSIFFSVHVVYLNAVYATTITTPKIIIGCHVRLSYTFIFIYDNGSKITTRKKNSQKGKRKSLIKLE